MDEEIKKEIRKFALKNAYEHKGKTDQKVVISKILGTRPEQRKNSFIKNSWKQGRASQKC